MYVGFFNQVLRERLLQQKGRDEKSLSQSTEASRQALAQQSAQEKLALDEALQQENRYLANKLERTTAKDSKGLSAELEVARIVIGEPPRILGVRMACGVPSSSSACVGPAPPEIGSRLSNSVLSLSYIGFAAI